MVGVMYSTISMVICSKCQESTFLLLGLWVEGLMASFGKRKAAFFTCGFYLFAYAFVIESVDAWCKC